MKNIPRYPRVLVAGDAAITVEFGSSIHPDIHDRVMAFSQAVERRSLPGVIEVVPTYRSATVYFDPIRTDAAALGQRLGALAHSPPIGTLNPSRMIGIPVLYGGEWGPDLSDVAAFAECSTDDVIALHTSVEYRVYMLGFLPGFAYMGPVPDQIAIPRLPTPRMRVAAGSVGIAGSQTGIYPLDSPGGWRLLGRTPLRLYDPAWPQPFLLAPNDRVRFVAIDQQEYERRARMQN